MDSQFLVPIGSEFTASSWQTSVFLDPLEVVGNLGVNSGHLPGTGRGPEGDDADDHPGVVRVYMQQRSPTVSPTSIRLFIACTQLFFCEDRFSPVIPQKVVVLLSTFLQSDLFEICIS